MQIKQSIAVAIRRGEQILVVQRPDDDEDLPGTWGLPAATLREGEEWEDAVERAGHEKLGVELRTGLELQRGSLMRKHYTLEMRLFEATLVDGVPVVPQEDASVTQYQGWKWGSGEDLVPAAEQGSLCSKLFLDSMPTQ